MFLLKNKRRLKEVEEIKKKEEEERKEQEKVMREEIENKRQFIEKLGGKLNK